MVICTEGPEGKCALKFPQMNGHSLIESAFVPWFIVQEGAALQHLEKRGASTSDRLVHSFTRRAVFHTLSDKLLLIGASAMTPPRLRLVGPSVNAPSNRASVSTLLRDVLHGGAFEIAKQLTYADWYAVQRTPASVVSSETSYGRLPYLRYEWASVTLVDAMRRGAISRWTMSHHLALLSRLASALLTLHENGRCHGDVRIEHVLCRGDESHPGSYFLAEHASVHSTSLDRNSRQDSGVLALPTNASATGTAPELGTVPWPRQVARYDQIRCHVLQTSSASWAIRIKGLSTIPRYLPPGTLLMLGTALLHVKRTAIHGDSVEFECEPYWYSRVGSRLAVLAEPSAMSFVVQKSVELTIIEAPSEGEDVFRIGVIVVQLVFGLPTDDPKLLEIVKALSNSYELVSRFPLRGWKNSVTIATGRETGGPSDVESWYRLLESQNGLSKLLPRKRLKHAWMIGLVWLAIYCMQFRVGLSAKVQAGDTQVAFDERGAAAQIISALQDLA